MEPNWAQVQRELKRKHVTLQILWDEYIARHPDGYRYSRFCDLYQGWAARLPVTMRQNHGAGEKLFVDYAGDTVPVVVDRLTGETRAAHLFVAVLGASSLSYAEARWSETLADWIGCHVNALESFGGAPALLVPDNAKVAMIKACRYDPQVNRSYAAMAEHYGSAVLPARPRRPRDKAKVEAAVRIVGWLLGRLRHRVFSSLAEVNAAISDLLADRGERRVLRRHPAAIVRGDRAPGAQAAAGRALRLCRMAHPARRSRLSCRDRPPLLLGPLALCRCAARGPHHGNDHRAVPQGRAHCRSHPLKRQWPAHHGARAHALLAPPFRRLDERADRTGSLGQRPQHGAAMREDPGRSTPHPEQGFRACLGIIRPAKGFGRERVNAACGRALEIGARTYGSVRSILDKRLDQAPRAAAGKPIDHPNIRGPRYYH